MTTIRLLSSWIILLTCFNAWGAFGNQSSFSLPTQQESFVTVDEAFNFSSYQQGNQLYLDWQIKPGYYLYQERMSITADKVTLGQYEMPTATPHHDEFFGEVHIYTTPTSLSVPLSDYQAGATITVSYQGCAEAGFCYPPETRHIEIASFSAAPSATVSPAAAPKMGSTTNTSSSTSSLSLAQQLATHWWAPLLFILFGIGMAFTPCVLPMYPILTSLVLGQKSLSPGKTLALSLIYVQGMALTYTVLGLIVASAGVQFQAALQQPVVLITLSVLFLLLAASMFGLFTLQLPSSLQTKLTQWSNQQQSGHALGVFVMGAISGLVCSPCTTAPLSGALLYVAQSGDLVTGAITLYALSIGMGIPLILAAMFGQRLLPKAGLWMNHVKTLFGFILLAAPIFLLERIIPETYVTLLWSLLGLISFAWAYHVLRQVSVVRWYHSLLTLAAILGCFFSAQGLWQWWQGENIASQQNSATAQTPSLPFTAITNLDELNQQLSLAKQQGKPVMLDFYADWCVACKEFEKYTFSTPLIRQHLSNFVLLQIDVTANTPDHIAVMKKMNVLGLPTIDFWNAQGDLQNAARVTGFMEAPQFDQHLSQFKL